LDFDPSLFDDDVADLQPHDDYLIDTGFDGNALGSFDMDDDNFRITPPDARRSPPVRSRTPSLSPASSSSHSPSSPSYVAKHLRGLTLQKKTKRKPRSSPPKYVEKPMDMYDL
jgi:hypothetical protein